MRWYVREYHDDDSAGDRRAPRCRAAQGDRAVRAPGTSKTSFARAIASRLGWSRYTGSDTIDIDRLVMHSESFTPAEIEASCGPAS